MKTRHKFGVVITVVIVFAVSVLTYKWPIIKFGLDGGGQYTGQDHQVYEYFTPEIMKKMPRITDDYLFDYHTVSGAGSVGNTLTFLGTTDTGKIDAYLASQGYIKQNSCMVKGDCWKGNDPTEDIVVSSVPEMNTVQVQIDYTPVSR